MRFLFDLQHPAHLHFFRNVMARLKAEGHEVKVTGRDKDILIELAAAHGIEMECFGVARKGLVNLGMEWQQRVRRLRRIAREFRPDAMLAIAGTYISAVGRMAGIPAYVFYDTEHATLSNLLAYPFSTCIYVPRCYRTPIRWRHERYNGYHELAYLAPKYFTPDETVLDEAGIKRGERFALLRFVGWGAAHDVGLRGFTNDNKRLAVETIAKHARPLISAEGDLPAELEPYRLKLNVARIHHLMAFASLVFGESATMASEGAVLGVPGVYVDPVGRGYTDEQEREYGLVFNFTSERQGDAIDRAERILRDADGGQWQEKRMRLLGEKIDVTDLIHEVATRRPHAMTRVA